MVDTPKEIIIFKDPHLRSKKSTPTQQKNSTSQNKQTNPKQHTNQQNDQQDQPVDPATQQGVQEGIKQGITEITKTEIQPKKAIIESGHHEGIKEAAKDAAKGKEETTGKLDSLVKSAQHPLLQLQTSGYLMLNLIPDILTIDALKVTVRYRSILADEKTRSVFVKDIGDVMVESIPFAASLRIIDNTDKDNPILIKPFKKRDAEKAKSIIKGLITAQKENIDPATLEKSPETIKKIETLGKDTQE